MKVEQYDKEEIILGYGGSLSFFKEPEIPHINMAVAGISTVLASAGIFTSWLVYSRKIINTENLVKKYKGLYNLVYNKYYIDEFYGWIFNNLFILTGKTLDWVDHNIVDGLFDGFARLINKTGKKLRLTQTGYLQSYALVIFAAIVIMIIAISTPILGGAIK